MDWVRNCFGPNQILHLNKTESTFRAKGDIYWSKEPEYCYFNYIHALYIVELNTFSSGYAVLPQVAHFSCVPENMPAALLGDLVCKFIGNKRLRKSKKTRCMVVGVQISEEENLPVPGLSYQPTLQLKETLCIAKWTCNSDLKKYTCIIWIRRHTWLKVLVVIPRLFEELFKVGLTVQNTFHRGEITQLQERGKIFICSQSIMDKVIVSRNY